MNFADPAADITTTSDNSTAQHDSMSTRQSSRIHCSTPPRLATVDAVYETLLHQQTSSRHLVLQDNALKGERH